MVETIIKTVISYLIPLCLGYLISQLKNRNIFKKALMTLFQNNLTNTYWVYEKMHSIPDYVYKNWLNSSTMYSKLGGNEYVHVLAEKMKQWDIVKTDILMGEEDEK